METRTLFYRRARGQDVQSVDSWYLVLRDDHSFWIEHLLSQSGEPDKLVGTERLTPLQVMFAVEDMGLLGCLRTTPASDLRPDKTSDFVAMLEKSDRHRM